MLSRIAKSCFVLLCAAVTVLAASAHAQSSYFREEIAAKEGKGPAVLIISGQTGPDPRRAYARDVAALGYNVLLVDGNDMLSRTKPAAQNFKDAIQSLLASPNTTSAGW